ncbi:MAG: type II toxin-antitoxin system VapC family toxin [Deltaproteobacteria bacterium]|nr:type II toxin-antitoxin system VapC family toxin [Deltaproteobacteria bacterium]
MEAIFVDTSAWDAIEDGGDSNHAAALSFKEDLAQQGARLYVTNFVLDECYTLLLRNIGYTRTVAFKQTLDRMRVGGILVVVHISEEIEKAAWEVFERFNQDKEWSFTDCTTKVVMETLGIKQVFAFDHHFDQMGFLRHP